MSKTIIEKLNSELAKRKKTNSSYSLRAFARDVGINHSLLSRIMASKLEVSSKMVERISENLTFTEEELSEIKKEMTFKKRFSSLSDLTLSEIKALSVEDFKSIQQCYHYAINEITKIDDFFPSCDWLSNRLNLSSSEAQYLFNKLIDLRMIFISDNGNYTIANDEGNNCKNSIETLQLSFQKTISLVQGINNLEESHKDVEIDESILMDISTRVNSIQEEIHSLLSKKQLSNRESPKKIRL